MTGNEVFIISKPIVPPWNDSGKNIAMAQVTSGSRYSYRVLTTRDFSFTDKSNIRYDRIYPSGGHFQAGLKQNLKVMAAGLRKKNARIYHYYFAPNKLSATAGRLQRAIARVKTIQTFSSRPASYDNIGDLIFTDRVIVLSADTKQNLLQAGVSPAKVVHIPPGIAPPSPLTAEEATALRHKYGLQNKRMVLFPGDFEFSDAASLVADAASSILDSDDNLVLVFACRAKTERSANLKQQTIHRLRSLGNRVRFLDEIDDMPRFVGIADIILLPQDNMYAKMDIPLVLLEAMAHNIPLVLADRGPLAELVEQKAGLGCRTAEELADRTIRILSTPDLAADIGNAGNKLIQTTYNATHMARAVEQLYDEVLIKTV
jgi:glycosyltransferase involved in cell wall biosynthesis